MRKRILCALIVVWISSGDLALGQETQDSASPQTDPNQGPTQVVVIATGGSDVTEEILIQVRLATVSAVAAYRERHEREVRPELDPGLALRASECGDDACLVAVGQDAQAAYLFVLMLERIDTGFRTTVLMTDVNAGTMTGSAAFELPPDPASFSQAVREPLSPLVSAITPINPTTGTLLITVDQVGAALFLNGERIGSSPLDPLRDVEQGTYELRVSMDGFLDFQQRVEVVAESTTDVSVTMTPLPDDVPLPPPPTPIWRRWWFWTIIGGVAAGAGLGVGLGVGLSGDTENHFQTGVEFPRWEQR